MRGFGDAIQLAQKEAERRFPEGEYTLQTLQWCDGDYRITVRNGFSMTEEENSLQKEIVVTPHQAKVQLRETTQSEEYSVHDEEVLQ